MGLEFVHLAGEEFASDLSDVVARAKAAGYRALVVTIDRHESIPEVLACLVQNHIRVFRLAAQEANLEQVYFTLHEEKEGVQ